MANAGCATLDVTGLAIDNGVFTTPTVAPFSVPVGGSAVLNLTFAPDGAWTGRGDADDHQH